MSQPALAEREIGHAQALRVMARALRLVGPLWPQFAVKLAYATASLLPLLLLPWPLKILVDHVINGDPIVAGTLRFPSYVRPFVDLLAGASPARIAVAVSAASLLLLFLVGGFGVPRGTGAVLTEGLDAASTSENRANYAVSLSSGILGWLEFRWQLRLTQRLNHQFRAHAFERIQRLALARFDDQSIGDALYRVMYDTPGITQLAYALIVTPVLSCLHIALAAWVLHATYPEAAQIAGLALLALPATFLATLPFSRAIRRAVALNRSTGATTTRTVEETMSNVLAVQSLGGMAREERRFAQDSWASYSAVRSYVRLVSLVGVVSAIAGSVLAFYVFWLVTDRIFEGTFTAGDFGVILGFYTQVGGSVAAIAGLWISSQNEVAALQRVFWIMDQPGEHEAPGARPLGAIRDGVELDGVEYAYPDGTPALRGVSLRARIGEVVALVGPAGAGKTTLAYLIPRFVDPLRGSVRIDGVDAREGTRESLRSQIAFVFQESVLLDATIEDNIRLGKPDATDAEVQRAAQAAGAHEFIAQLTDGYCTRIGRDGGQLSVGQRQRLSIARALVREAAILILDEPTSALDPETEQQLVKSIHAASERSLVLVIAHRLSTIRGADQILFVERGEIVERGNHAELMARSGGAYRRFVELQASAQAA